jgi:hypothetical protein
MEPADPKRAAPADREKATRPLGRPSMLDLDPTLAPRIVNLLKEGLSLQQVADQLRISIRTLRNWVREGERLESGPRHDIAAAANASMERRGFAHRRPSSDPQLDALRPPVPQEAVAPGSGQTPIAEAPAAAAYGPAWSNDCLLPWSGNALRLEALDLTELRLAMCAMTEAAVESSPPPATAARASGQGSPAASPHYQIYRVQIGDAGSPSQLSTLEFEELRRRCHVHQFGDLGHIVRLVTLWPREMSELTCKQKHIVEKGTRVLVADRDHDFFEVQFALRP